MRKGNLKDCHDKTFKVTQEKESLEFGNEEIRIPGNR